MTRGRKKSDVQKSPEEIREQARLRKQKSREKRGTIAVSPHEKELKPTWFIGIDGEGRDNPKLDYYYEDENGEYRHVGEEYIPIEKGEKVKNDEKQYAKSAHQDYTLLQASTGEYIEDVNGLSTYDCCYFLCSLALKYPRAQFVIYGGSYDMNMWLRDMSYTDHIYLRNWMELDRLHRVGNYEKHPTTNKVYKVEDVPHVESVGRKPQEAYITFEIEWLQKKEMVIKCIEVKEDGSPKFEKYAIKDKQTGALIEKRRKVEHGRFQVYDTLGFFGCKFMKALKDMDLLTNEDDKDFLQNMKDARNQFKLYSLDVIRDYCKKECDYLVKLMQKLERYCIELGLEVKRWDGAGAIAAAMMKKHQIKDHIKELENGVLEAAQHAFSGGRIELIRYGHCEGKEYVYDKGIESLKRKWKDSLKQVTNGLKGEKKKKVLTEEIERIKQLYYTEIYELDGIRMNKKRLNGYVDEMCGGRLEDIEEKVLRKLAENAIWDYDVNSAYPTCIRVLPSLAGGEWKLETEINSAFACCHVRWDLQEKDKNNPVRIFPFFYRKESGMIIYPEKGENWVWLPEYEAYLKHKDTYDGNVELLEVYNFYPATDVKPFAFVDEYAKLRLEWKKLYRTTGGKEGGAHIVLKLGLNSLYGKTAQQIGWHYDENWNKILPPFHNLAWAGFITSFCRAKVYEAGMHKPHAVVMFATDGLFLTSPLEHLPLTDKLGEWELTTATKFTALQSGVYFSDSGSEQSSKTRGFEAGSITEEMIIDAWNKGVPSPSYDRNGRLQSQEWIVTGRTRKFVTIRSLLSSHELWDIDEVSRRDFFTASKASRKRKEMLDKKNRYRYCSWESIPREQALTPQNTKRDRDAIQNPYHHPKWNAARLLLPTIPALDQDYRTGKSMSKKYQLLWVEESHHLTDFEKVERQSTDDSEEYLETSEG